MCVYSIRTTPQAKFSVNVLLMLAITSIFKFYITQQRFRETKPICYENNKWGKIIAIPTTKYISIFMKTTSYIAK